MKIALVHRSLGRSLGGVEAYLYEIATALLAEGHEVVAMAPEPTIRQADAMPGGVEIHPLRLGEGSRMPLFRWRSHIAAIRTAMDAACRGCDAVWARAHDFAIAASRVSNQLPVVYIQADVRGPYRRLVESDSRTHRRSFGAEYRYWKLRREESVALKSITAAVQLSQSRRLEVLQEYGNRFQNVCHVVPPGVNLNHFKPRDWTSRPKHNLELLSVARLSTEKNFVTLFKAVALLVRRGLPVTLRVAGDGPKRSELESLISELQIGGSIELLGRRTDVVELYQTADLFVMPSTYEGFGNVYLEAFACAVPCLALRRREPDILVAAEEIIDHRETGLLVGENMPEAIAEAIEEAYCSRETLQEWGHRARKVCEQRFTWNRAVDRLLSLSGIKSNKCQV